MNINSAPWWSQLIHQSWYWLLQASNKKTVNSQYDMRSIFGAHINMPDGDFDNGTDTKMIEIKYYEIWKINYLFPWDIPPKNTVYGGKENKIFVQQMCDFHPLICFVA